MEVTYEQVCAIHKAFDALDTDDDGLISDEEMLGAVVRRSRCRGWCPVSLVSPPSSQSLEPNKFTTFLKKFLVAGKHATDKLDFGDWLHMCTRICLFGNDQMVRWYGGKEVRW